jgi:3-hydroxyacyl-CoA dehydrogenase
MSSELLTSQLACSDCAVPLSYLLGLDLVIETVPERMDIKRVVLAQIDTRLPSIIASNTSAMSINELAKCVKDPSSFSGNAFFQILLGPCRHG